MKGLAVLTVIFVALVSMEVARGQDAGECDKSAGLACTATYNTEKYAADDETPSCTMVKKFLDCLKDAKCLDENQEKQLSKELGPTCGVSLVSMEVARGQETEECDEDAGVKCINTHNINSVEVKGDNAKFCLVVEKLRDCLKDAKCQDEMEEEIRNNMKENGYKCDVVLVSMEVARGQDTGGCDKSASLTCENTYTADSYGADDETTFCTVVETLLDCLKDAKCLDEGQEKQIRGFSKDLGYTCGVARGQETEECEGKEVIKCSVTHNINSVEVKDDNAKFCSVVKQLRDCLKDAKCLDENMEKQIRGFSKDLGHTCGVAVVSMETEGCDEDAGVKCINTHNINSVEVKGDNAKFCLVVEKLRDCLKEAKCQDVMEEEIQNNMKENGYKCDVALVSMEVARVQDTGGCDKSAALKCRTAYYTESSGADDETKSCAVEKKHLDCMKDAKCLDENQEKQLRYNLKKFGNTCGASLWTANMVLIFATLFVTLKNFF